MDTGAKQKTLGVWAGFAVSTAIGLALGAIGPFGSYLNGTLPVRLAYWVVCLWAGWLAFGFSLPRLSAWAQGRAPLWLWAPPAVAVLALLPAAVSRALAVWLWPVVGKVGWLEWYGQCLLISALVTLGVLWRTRAVTAGPNHPRDSASSRVTTRKCSPSISFHVACTSTLLPGRV